MSVPRGKVGQPWLTHFTVNDLTFQEVTLYSHLVDILTFFVRQHLFRTRNIIHSETLAPRVAQLLKAPQKHLKLVALKFFRTLISLQDTFYQALMTHNNTFGLIIDIVHESMPRDNLLNSACLELFEFIKRENIKPFILHVVEKYREKLESITYVDTFQNLVNRFDQLQGYDAEADSTLFSQDGDSTPRRIPLNGQRWQGVKELDAVEEEYFNGSDDEDDVSDICIPDRDISLMEAQWAQDNRAALAVGAPNGSASPLVKPLVDYPDDDDEDVMDTNPEDLPEQPVEDQPLGMADVPVGTPPDATATPVSPAVQTPPAPERLAEKRRREEEDEDELIKLATGPKRRSSTSSHSSTGSINRKKTMSIGTIGSVDKGSTGVLGSVTDAPPKRITISLGSTGKSPPADGDGSLVDAVPGGNNEKENRDDTEGDKDG